MKTKRFLSLFLALLLSLLLVFLQITALQQTAVHLGMQGLHATVEQLRSARVVRNLSYRQAQFLQVAAGATRGNKLNILGYKALGKLIKPGLIRNGKQGALNSCCFHDKFWLLRESGGVRYNVPA